MKTLLEKSLITYLIFNVAILISANAQIVYTDVNPDVTVSNNGGVYHLDLNNDSTIDFNISMQTGDSINGLCGGIKPFVKISISTVVGNYVAATYNPSSASPTMLSFNAPIDNTIIWSAGTLFLIKDYWSCNPWASQNYIWNHYTEGQWFSATDKYLGLKINLGGNNYSGWIRLDAHSNSTSGFTIKDYAYNSIPNQPILAGQTTTTGIIENNFSKHLSLYSFNKTLNIELNNATQLNGNITVCNTLGQELKKIKIENSTMQIDMSDCNSGIYFVSVQTNKAIETKKIYLK